MQNEEYQICKIGADMLRNDQKRLQEFLLANNNEKDVQGRDTFVWIMSHYGVGEGNVPIATSNSHNIVVGVDDDGNNVVINMKSYGDVWHHKMADKKSLIAAYRNISGKFYDLMIKALNVNTIDECLSDIMQVFVKGHFIAARNVNKNYSLECSNLQYSLLCEGYDQYPSDLSVAGQNLEQVAETLVKFAIQQEDLDGNKMVSKKSEVDANPLIVEAVKKLVFQLAVDEIEKDRSEQKVEA